MKKAQTLKLYPAQMAVIRSRKGETLYSGGYGSGKSLCACVKTIQHAQIPGNIVLLMRKTLKSLKNSTLSVLLKEEINGQKILPPGAYKYHKNDGTIQLNGGGIIIITGMDERTKIRSINAGAVIIDEVSEFTEAEYIELKMRLRNPHAKIRQLCGFTNPASRNHFLYKRFYTKDVPGWEDRFAIRAPSTQNTALPADYIKNLKNMPEQERQRYLEGYWTTIQGNIFPSFKPEKHVQEIAKIGSPLFNEYTVALDLGYTHPAAILLCGNYGDNRIHVLEEFRQKGMLISDIIAHLEKYRNLEPTIVCDPAAASLKAAVENAGWTNVINANNDVKNSISRILNKLSERDGMYGLTISPNCPMLIDEIQEYHYKDETEQPVKIGDDLMDTLRYTVNYYDDQYDSYIKPIFGGDVDD